MKTLMRAAALLAVLLADWLSGASRDQAESGRAPVIRFIVKHPWVTAAAIAVVVMIGAALGVVSGVVPIKASSGHWPITARFLDFAKARSVATHSLGIEPPSPLDDEALLIRGAGHYENGCYGCHGGPGGGIPPVMAAMTPPPPELTNRISRWKPEELFSIVKHGIKFTGMPAWPVQQRDDEVWAMVAFLRRMPNLDDGEYRRLAHGERDAADAGPSLSSAGLSPPRAVRETCSRCHGIDGTGRGPDAFPSLAGQRSEYLYASLRAFAGRTRFSGIMSTVAANLSDEAMREVAAYYEQLPPRSTAPPPDQAAAARGAAIAARGIPERDVPSCADCHGPSDVPRNRAYPIIARQPARYLALQLELLKARRRGGSAHLNLMQVFVDRLSSEQIRDVTFYYASLDVWPDNSAVVPER
jgi:cytochrome c553/cytochrome c5